MRLRTIHQFHSGSACGDAVTNGMLLTQRLLRGMGFESEIYVEHLATELAGSIKHFKQYRSATDQLLLVHHSHGHDQLDWLLRQPERKVLVYHNITPAEFFPEGDIHRQYALLGRQQLTDLRGAVCGAFCDSEYNAQELRQLGYSSVSVLPLLIDRERIEALATREAPPLRDHRCFTVLFVGRVAPNKCQHDLLAILHELQRLASMPVRLVLVGGYHADEAYFRQLRQQVEQLGLEESVVFTGRVTDQELYQHYQLADVYLSMSEHEGFGVPLIESMLFDLPVIAYASSAVADTLNGAGLLITEKHPRKIAALLHVLARNRTLRRSLVAKQRQRVDEFAGPVIETKLREFLAEQHIDVPAAQHQSHRQARLRYQLEGPFETSYSLAVINRETGMALEQCHPKQVAFFATEGPGDYQPAAADIERHAGLHELWQRSRRGARAEVVLRNLYPPRIADMDGRINLLNFFWEESEVPREWIEAMNRHLDALTVATHFVKKTLIDVGVSVPIHVVGAGVNHILRYQRNRYAGNLGGGFRFLHVSSCFPRKGVDLLLEAFASTFSDQENVSLVIKTFSNIHNRTGEQIADVRRRYPRCPEIVLIEQDLAPGELRDVMERCHALVAPSRGEGFGLPLAEAMLLGIPVITTAYGGQRDFCTDRTAWLVDYQFVRSASHLASFASTWVEPDLEDLARAMRDVYEATPEQRSQKTTAARKFVSQHLTWEETAGRIDRIATRLGQPERLKPSRLKLGWVTSWNTRCGIACYSRYLLQNLPPNRYEVTVFGSHNDILEHQDEPSVVRCWGDHRDADLGELKRAILARRLDAVVLQFNFGFFNVQSLAGLVTELHAAGVRTMITFHATADVDKPDFHASLSTGADGFARADRLLVHSVVDRNRLKTQGMVDNVAILPHGVLSRSPSDPGQIRQQLGLEGRRLIASYGFLLPGKGIEQLIEALPRIRKTVPDAALLLVNALYSNPMSTDTQARCREIIESLGIGSHVAMINDFLEDQESLQLLEAAELVVFPYQQSSESSSAAVRIGLASNRPVACTPLPVFDDVAACCHLLPGTGSEDLARGIKVLLADDQLRESKSKSQQRWLNEHCWSQLGRRMDGMIQALIQNTRTDDFLAEEGVRRTSGASPSWLPERPRSVSAASTALAPQSIERGTFEPILESLAERGKE